MATDPRQPELDAATLRLQAELLSLPARHLRELPVQTRIVAHHQGMNKDIVLSSGPSTSPLAGAAASLSFDGDELRAMALGVESERLWAWDFTGFCLLKQHDPRFHVTEAVALAGAQASDDEPAWPLGKVLERLGLVVSSVELADADAARPAPGQRTSRAA